MATEDDEVVFYSMRVSPSANVLVHLTPNRRWFFV